MSEVLADLGMSGDLATKVIRAPQPHPIRTLARIPGLGRIMVSSDPGSATISGREFFQSELYAVHRGPDGRVVHEHDLGSGLVTNVGVNMLVNDINWITAATPFATLSSQNFHAIGTGTTAAAATDFYLQTPQGATNISGSTNGYMAGAQTVVAPNIYQTVATFTFTGAVAVTEWALAMSNAANVARTAVGTPTATTFPDSGATYTTTGNGLKGWTVEVNATAINTPTTTVAGLVTANTATSLTVANGWWTLANASAATPGVNAAYVVYPTAWDHKVFAVINVASGDSLQLTYKLTANSGG